MWSDLEKRMLTFMRDQKMVVGHVFPEKPFRFKFYPSLNPPDRRLVPSVFQKLKAEGILDIKQPVINPITYDIYFLTQNGEEVIYAPNFGEVPPNQPIGTDQREASVTNNITNNFHGSANVQIGDHNSLVVNNYLREIEAQIEASDKTPIEKEQAKSLLMKISENPLLAGIISGLGAGTLLPLLRG